MNIYTQEYLVVKGVCNSETREMCDVSRTTEMPVQKDSKLTWCELWEIDVARIMKEDFIEKDKDRSEYRWLLMMTTCSKGSIGALLASSFFERIHSCANQVVTSGNTLLDEGEIKNLVMCCMNRDFMLFMHEHYPHVANEQFKFGTILTVEDNEEDEDE